MKLFSLQDKYLKQFENEFKSEFYKKCLEIIEYNNSHTLLYDVLICLENAGAFIETVDIANNFIKFVYGHWPLRDFSSLTTSLTCYIEEEISNNVYSDTPEYAFYKANRIWMENFYEQYYGKTLQVTFHKYNIEKKLGPIPNFEIIWSETNRQAMSIVFNNKTYTYGLCYEKKHVEGLHFWRINEDNHYERFSLIPSSSMYEEFDIIEREFFNLDYMYIWIADTPGDITSDTQGPTSEWYTLV